MPEEQQPESVGPPPAKRQGGRRRGRRGGRGRGPRRAAPAGPAGEIDAPASGAPVSEPSPQAESSAEQLPPIRLGETPVHPEPSKPKSQPAHHAAHQAAPVHAARVPKPGGSVIGQTVAEVRQIVESLEQSLEQMEEVLRLVELAEQQKSADERELESLRRALHRLQPPHRERREDGR